MKFWDALWVRVTRLGTFLLGILIMYHETFTDTHERPYLYLAALSLMGPQLAETIARVLGTFDRIVSLLKSEIKSPHHIEKQSPHGLQEKEQRGQKGENEV